MMPSTQTYDITTFDQTLSRVMDLFYAGINHDAQKIYDAADSSADDDFYTKHMSGLFSAIEAVLSLERELMEDALVKLNIASAAAEASRKKNKSWTSWIPGNRVDYDSYTDIECHAELAYADCMVFTAACTAGRDPSSWLGVINAALYANTAYNTYQTCFQILNNKTNWQSNIAKIHFESGTRLAIGVTDLMVSFVPSKFVKLVELAGFSGDRQFGLTQLKMSESLTDGSRWPASSLILGGYNLFLEYTYGLAEPDLELVEQIARKCEVKFPNVIQSSVFILQLSITFFHS
jgi:hypothetical protein